MRERFGLAQAEHERPENLPAGVRQRAGLALSTLHAPRLLFLDEPTAGVDVESRGLFWELIQDASDEGVTVFVTTHFLEEADYCDRVAFIDAGKLVADSTPEGLRARYSSGYRIEARARGRHRASACSPSSAARASRPRRRAIACVARTSRRSTPTGCGALTRVLGPEAAASVRIEQASMNDVFRRLIREGAAAAPPTGAAAVNARRLRTLVRREVKATLRDPFTLGVLIAVPLVALLAVRIHPLDEGRGHADRRLRREPLVREPAPGRGSRRERLLPTARASRRARRSSARWCAARSAPVS